MKKKLMGILIIEAVVLLILNILNTNFFKVGNIVQFPYIQISKILRTLSLNGGISNVIAWLLIIVISITPTIVLYFIHKKKKVRQEDYLLILVSVLLFTTIYLGINSKFILVGEVKIVDLAYYLSILTTQIIFLYIALKFLKVEVTNKSNLKIIISILFLTTVISVFNIFGPKLNEISESYDRGLIYTESYEVYDEEGSPTGEIDISTMINYEFIENALGFLSNNILDLVYIFLSMQIIGVLIDIEKDRKENSVISKLYSLKKATKYLFIASIVLSILINFIFIVYANNFTNIKLKPLLNLDLVVFIVIINYIVNYLIKVKELKEENEMFV